MIWNENKDETVGIESIWLNEIGKERIEYIQIVRCKDCKYWYNGCCYSRVSNRINFTVEVPDDWFCADGERKEDDE